MECREDVAAQLRPSSLRQCRCSGQASTQQRNVPKLYRTRLWPQSSLGLPGEQLCSEPEQLKLSAPTNWVTYLAWEATPSALQDPGAYCFLLVHRDSTVWSHATLSQEEAGRQCLT